MIDINVKILSDRKVEFPHRRYGGTQGDTGYRVKFDISDIYDENNLYRIEWFGAADSFTQTIPLEVNDGIVVCSVPKEISKAGGTAVAYLIEESVGDSVATERICTYPIRLYFNNKPTGNNSVVVGEYERNVTDVYLAMVNAKNSLDRKATVVEKQLEEANTNYNNAVDKLEEAQEKINNAVGVRYDTAQELTDEQKEQARDNIGAEGKITFADNSMEKVDDGLKVRHTDELSVGDEGLGLNGEILSGRIDERVGEKIFEHSIDASAHNDIRIVIQGLSDRINALHDCDDTTLDQTKEIVAYIKENRSVLEGVTTNKVNVADIIDNLITNVSNKPLSAAQGVMLKGLIDEVSAQLGNYATKDDVDALDVPRNVRISSYDNSSVEVNFETGIGNSHTSEFNIDLTVDGKFDVYLHKIAIDGGYGYSLNVETESSENTVARVYAFTYKVTNGEFHYLVVGNSVVLNKLVTIESVTCDGTAGTYTFSNLNLEYLLLDITSLAGFESNQSYRVFINGNSNYIVGYLNNLVHTTNKQEAFVRIDLKNLQSLKGIATDKSGIPAQETKVGSNALQNISAITSITIAPYNSDVLIQNGSTITLKGREVQ